MKKGGKPVKAVVPPSAPPQKYNSTAFAAFTAFAGPVGRRCEAQRGDQYQRSDFLMVLRVKKAGKAGKGGGTPCGSPSEYDSTAFAAFAGPVGRRREHSKVARYQRSGFLMGLRAKKAGKAGKGGGTPLRHPLRVQIHRLRRLYRLYWASWQKGERHSEWTDTRGLAF